MVGVHANELGIRIVVHGLAIYLYGLNLFCRRIVEFALKKKFKFRFLAVF